MGSLLQEIENNLRTLKLPGKFQPNKAQSILSGKVCSSEGTAFFGGGDLVYTSLLQNIPFIYQI